MSERHIGLDIGSFGVRAAEVSVESGLPTLHRFAQITLPPGAVVEGQVVDQAAVASSIRQLWSKGGFKQRRVVVGVASKDVKVRQAEVPNLPPDELRSALRFEAPDLIPIADVESIVDFVIQERFTRDGAEMLRLLVVVAPQSQIDESIAAVSAAGLEVEAVDLIPLALVRSLGARLEPGRGEVIVSVGAGLTTVVVHAGGVPQLVRTTGGGGGTITEAIASRLSVAYEQAEAVKRMASPHTPEGAAATALIDEQLVVLVREIVGSVDYFVSQTADIEVEQIILTGAGSLVPGLRERVRSESHLDVLPADALRNVVLGKTRLTPEQLVAASTTLGGPIGLALAPLAEPGTRLTGLLPDHYRRRQSSRREKRMAIAAVAATAVLLTGVSVEHSFSVGRARADVTRVQRLQAVVAGNGINLQKYAAEDADLVKRTALVQAALADDVNASSVLDQLTAALPPDVWLLSMQLTMPTSKGAGSATFTLGGEDATSPAHWLDAVRAMPTVFGNVWVSSITSGTGKASVEFSSTAALLPTATAPRPVDLAVPK